MLGRLRSFAVLLGVGCDGQRDENETSHRPANDGVVFERTNTHAYEPDVEEGNDERLLDKLFVHVISPPRMP